MLFTKDIVGDIARELDGLGHRKALRVVRTIDYKC